MSEIKSLPKHTCDVFDPYYEGNYFSLRCRVCNKAIIWADLVGCGGGIEITFLNNDSDNDQKDAMYLTKDEAQKLR